MEMEYLRWILLAGGILFIILIYVLGKRRNGNKTVEEDFDSEDLPSFSARDWDELEEGVGEVRIIARHTDDELTEDKHNQEDETISPEQPRPLHEGETGAQPAETTSGNQRTDDSVAVRQPSSPTESEVIVLYILARQDSKLGGDRINSAVRANGMVFGDMNIFHRLDEHGKPVYSLANMLKPGSFDPARLHEMNTPGVTLFMQLPGPVSPAACFNDMLAVAYRIADMLDAQLCNSKRQPLDESDTESLRKKVAKFDA